MSKTIILFAATAALLTGPAVASEVTPLSPSVFSIGALPEDGYVSASIVAYGKPPEKKPEEKRRFEVGFVPHIPPPPNGEEAKTEKAAMTIETDGEAVKPVEASMDAGEPKDGVSDEKTASVDGSEPEGTEMRVKVEDMELRTN